MDLQFDRNCPPCWTFSTPLPTLREETPCISGIVKLEEAACGSGVFGIATARSPLCIYLKPQPPPGWAKGCRAKTPSRPIVPRTIARPCNVTSLLSRGYTSTEHTWENIPTWKRFSGVPRQSSSITFFFFSREIRRRAKRSDDPVLRSSSFGTLSL